MSAATQETQSDELEDHLSDLIGAEPDPKDETEEEPEKQAAEEEPEPEPEPEKEPEEVPETEATEEEPKTESASDEAAKRLAAAEKREKGLEAEIVKLRRERQELRQREMAASRATAPAPTRDPSPAAPAAEAAKAEIPVLASEDGSRVYVDRDALAKEVEALADKRYEEKSKPTPEQQKAMEHQAMARDFIESKPAERERRQQVYEEASQADNFIELAVTNIMQSQGIVPNTVQELTSLMRHAGVSEQVEQYFPAVAPVLDEFVAAYASGQAGWKRSILDRMAMSSAAPVTEPDTPAPERELESVADAPKSMARKGGARSTSPSADEAQFDALEKEYFADAIGFPEKKYEQYMALGKKLGKEGVI